MESAQREIIIVTGFGDKGIPELGAALLHTMQCISIVHGCPRERAAESPDARIETIQDEIRKRTVTIDVIGHSYGALLALAAALRERLKNISHLILIDGPLRHDVKVRPPNDRRFDIFNGHYEERARIAEECANLIKKIRPQGNMLTMGNEFDLIVPGDAKSLEDLGVPHVTLPRGYEGHDLRTKLSGVVPHILDFLGYGQRKATGF